MSSDSFKNKVINELFVYKSLRSTVTEHIYIYIYEESKKKNKNRIIQIGEFIVMYFIYIYNSMDALLGR